jgi:hypothetical protein
LLPSRMLLLLRPYKALLESSSIAPSDDKDNEWLDTTIFKGPTNNAITMPTQCQQKEALMRNDDPRVRPRRFSNKRPKRTTVVVILLGSFICLILSCGTNLVYV